jgi:UDP-N-acetylmuramyl pentapeptide phosphotransferase/UDP-N-acetylglucosamine-1-phosphate transferase
VTGAVAAVGARLAYAALRAAPPGGEQTWTRTNHRGESLTLLEGPAVTAGALAAVGVSKILCTERPVASVSGSAIPALALGLAGAGAAAFGTYDDLAGSGKRRGLRGHLGALAHGEVTTGAVKLLGIGATGLVSAGVLDGQRNPADLVINTGIIAGSANLLNLFDLRPGRAIKVALASGTLLAAAQSCPRATTRHAREHRWSASRDHWAFGLINVSAPLGAAVALLPDDLGERAMLGDSGANALGAMLGAAAAATLPRPARAALLSGIVALTVASEKISFTKVIERTPPLRWLDMLGRRPPAPRE